MKTIPDSYVRDLCMTSMTMRNAIPLNFNNNYDNCVELRKLQDHTYKKFLFMKKLKQTIEKKEGINNEKEKNNRK